MNKWIQIWYSWGDIESPVEVPEDVDAWEYIKQLVAKEVFVAQEGWPDGCTVYADAEKGRVDLKYLKDDEWCYYLITDEENFDPFDWDEE